MMPVNISVYIPQSLLQATLQRLCSNMQQGVQLLHLCLLNGESLRQAVGDLQQAEAGAKAGTRMAAGFAALQGVLIAIAAHEADTMADWRIRVTAAMVPLVQARNGLAEHQLRPFGSQCSKLPAVLAALKAQHKKLLSRAVGLQNTHDKCLEHLLSMSAKRAIVPTALAKLPWRETLSETGVGGKRSKWVEPDYVYGDSSRGGCSNVYDQKSYYSQTAFPFEKSLQGSPHSRRRQGGCDSWTSNQDSLWDCTIPTSSITTSSHHRSNADMYAPSP